ncbi:MAG: CPXCG motif-containing cysteine-rich protein [Pseudomonadota bacterium]|jgi:hypothetical protein|nr:CPXCG motif-containing cysteine-rich protein [Pseudomonadota bacterium]
MLEDAEIQCPYCWETIVLELDLSAGAQTYTEDCSVCCRPMLVRLETDGEAFSVHIQAEDE